MNSKFASRADRVGTRLAPRGLGAALLLAAISPAAYANLVVNGSFEAGAPGCIAGATTLSGWTVSGGNIDIVAQSPSCVAAPAADGTYFIDLTGSYSAGAGTIYQDLATAVGQQYELNFSFGGNPEWQPLPSAYANDGPVKALNVLLDGNIAGNYSQDTTGHARSDAGWTSASLFFTATAATTRLAFESLNGASGTVYGPFLDNVRVNPVPLPAAAWLLLSGLAGVGAMARRRRSATNASA
jgi:choice-of-anchor C domain-containing protein